MWLHPSPLSLLPSSHCSPESNVPLPQFLILIGSVDTDPPPGLVQSWPHPVSPPLPPLPPPPPPPPLPPFPPDDFGASIVALEQLAPTSRATAPAKSKARWLLKTEVPRRVEIVFVDIGRASSGGGCKNRMSLPTHNQYNNRTTRPEKRNFLARNIGCGSARTHHGVGIYRPCAYLCDKSSCAGLREIPSVAYAVDFPCRSVAVAGCESGDARSPGRIVTGRCDINTARLARRSSGLPAASRPASPLTGWTICKT
jgi:hypothetical protein